jgi:(p)ppGpp synthase/HD superfamily hydrolase
LLHCCMMRSKTKAGCLACGKSAGNSARAARIVDGCTDSYTEPKPPWRARKLAHIQRVAAEPADVRLVSAADKLSNARETLHELRVHGDSVFEKFEGKKEGTLWYYRALVEVFRKAGTNPLID